MSSFAVLRRGKKSGNGLVSLWQCETHMAMQVVEGQAWIFFFFFF